MGQGPGDRVRVATYNLYLGADLEPVMGHRTPEKLRRNLVEVRRQLAATSFSGRSATLARAIATEQPDLVGLQEVCTWSSDGEVFSDYRAELLASLEAAGAAYEVVSSQTTFSGAGRLEGGDGRMLRLEGSNDILRRRDSAVRVGRTGGGLFGDALTVRLASGEVAIARGWCDASCTVDGRPGSEFRFFDTHTEAYAPGSRNRQRDELVGILGSGDERLVVVGDFNAGPADVGMPATFQDAWTAAGHTCDDPRGWTCCQAADLGGEVSTLTERIDYVWVRGVEVTGARRVGADPGDRTPDGRWPSDHAGVVADLVLR